MIIVTGGAGFIGSTFVLGSLLWNRRSAHFSGQSISSHNWLPTILQARCLPKRTSLSND